MKLVDTALMGIARHSIRLPDGREFGPADIGVLRQWAREGRIPPDAQLIDASSGVAAPVMTEPSLASIIHTLGVQPTSAAAPPTVIIPTAQPPGDESIAVIIPYKNPHALTGYYVSIGSLIPIVGLIAGPAAIVLGVVGIRKRKENPRLHGLAHAWVAIVVGILGTLISLGCSLSIIMAIVSGHHGP